LISLMMIRDNSISTGMTALAKQIGNARALSKK
jgi:hypothetical protein